MPAFLAGWFAGVLSVAVAELALLFLFGRKP